MLLPNNFSGDFARDLPGLEAGDEVYHRFTLFRISGQLQHFEFRL